MNPLPMSPNGVTHVPGPYIKSGDDDRAHAFDRFPAGPMKLTPRRHKNALARRISDGIELA
jgi:hypothetical protein